MEDGRRAGHQPNTVLKAYQELETKGLAVIPQDPWVLSHWFVGSIRWTRYIPPPRGVSQRPRKVGWRFSVNARAASR